MTISTNAAAAPCALVLASPEIYCTHGNEMQSHTSTCFLTFVSTSSDSKQF